MAHLNTSDPSKQCPSTWREFNASGIRACGRSSSTKGSCSGNLYTIDRQYSRVCGRIIGYQVASPDGFTNPNSINASQMYMDGVSITYGTPRVHIWSYIAGVTENNELQHQTRNCPCSINQGSGSQLFCW